MIFRKTLQSIVLFTFIFVSPVFAQSQAENENQVLQKSMELIRRYFIEDQNWQASTPDLEKDVKGLLDFIENQPIDSILNHLDKSVVNLQNYVIRYPGNVEDSLGVPGYLSRAEQLSELEKITVAFQQKIQENPIVVPDSLLENIEKKVALVPEGEGIQLFNNLVYEMPDSLIIPEIIPDSVLNNTVLFSRLMKTDSLRNRFIEEKRMEYNNSLLSAYRDSLILDFRNKKFEEGLATIKKQFADSVNRNNEIVLTNYNNEVIKQVNDSIQFVLLTLAAYADYIDSTQITLNNLKDESTNILLQRGNGQFAKLWLKNKQNDSLSVLVKSIDKRTVQLLIDDGVTFSRFKPKETKEFDFSSLNKHITGLTDVGNLYKKETPWRIGGDGNIGFTQTYLENWKKGGKSALSLLLVLKGFANYEGFNGKVKWENSAEIRNGWIRQGDSNAELQKNDDKFELTSRFGLSAFKKWYYSAELNYNTQFFRGYKYPTQKYPEPISAFMAPARTFFKLGLDYKPNKDFSLFLSPITVKNVYVRDTAMVDQTKFSIAANKKSFWEPGLNADLKYKKALTKDIVYSTKYKMFINYKQPFKKFDINWENNLSIKLTDYISMKMLLHLIYDDDVIFPIYDDNDVKIGEKPKLQIKEFITVGFSYTINRQVMRTKRIR